MEQPQAPHPLTLLLELGQAFHSTQDLDPLLRSILQQIQAAAQGEAASLWLEHAPNAGLRCAHALGPGAEALAEARLDGPSLWNQFSPLRGMALRLDDARAPGTAADCLPPAVRSRARNAVLAPLVARGEHLGAVIVINKLGQPAFSDDDAALLAALAAHAALAIQNAQLVERQQRGAARQALLDQISRHLQSTLDSDTLIPRILQEVNTALEAEAQSLWLLNPRSQVLECRFATGPGAEAIKRVTVPVGQGIVGRSVLDQAPIVIPDAQEDPRTFRAADEQTGYVTHSLVCVPLVRQGQAIGAIEAINKRDGLLFSADDLDLLRSIADSAALAIENARLFAELARSYDSTLEALAAALDLRDRETEGHSRRVVAYTARLARALELGERHIRDICRGALIHDIGKIGVPDAVLLKPGTLDEHERSVMEQHPRAGYEMLAGIPYLQDEIEIVLAHQEHWDGTGYPLGLRGEAIPLGARLFAVADTFDALTSDRPYRARCAMAEARAVIAAEAGRQFDPAVASAFLSIPLEEWEQLRARVEAEVAERREQHRARAPNGRSPGLR